MSDDDKRCQMMTEDVRREETMTENNLQQFDWIV